MKKIAIAVITSICLLSSTSTALAGSQNLNYTVYKPGVENEDVKLIQQALRRDGVFDSEELTTYFGPITERAVKDFQRKYGLTADGVIGESTIKKMESLGLFTYGNLSLSVYKKGIKHSDVKVIQESLREIGTFKGDEITTYFGSTTEKAVKDFQVKYGLDADGVVGGSTMKKMVSLGLVTHNIGIKKVLGTLSLNLYEKGVSHPEVKIIQMVLKQCGTFHEDSYTTYFGPATEKAVKEFQKKYGLDVDGVAGGTTLQKMQSLGFVSYSVSRGSSKRGYGEYLDWKDVKKILVRNKTIMTVQDLKTSTKFKVKVTAGSNHADVETITNNDTVIMKKIWGGFSWERRPVLVYVNGRTIAASMTAMPHAGVESKTAGKNVSNRSGGYGYGYNFDFIKGNGMSGHVDIHFKNSRRHKDNRKDPKHQASVKIAAGKK
ncbi:peptidoglycan-binding protein [Wukongibacter baidiensis]|uniref:peptidoglycan-binding domain-containing protein n=1 Tax=Wukongibacter baidiensis TaxID=1723361 RepID=UPI003D7F2609